MWSDAAREAAAQARKGTHSAKVDSLPDKYTVRVHQAFTGRTASGQRNTNVGNIWAKASGPKRQAVAERIAQNMRVDNPDKIVKVK